MTKLKRVCRKFKETRAGRRCAKFGKPSAGSRKYRLSVARNTPVFIRKQIKPFAGRLFASRGAAENYALERWGSASLDWFKVKRIRR